MKIFILFIAFFAFGQSANSHAYQHPGVQWTLNQVTSGEYSHGGSSPLFNIQRDGTVLTLKDYLNDITHVVDAGASGEQQLSNDYIQFLRRNPKTSSFGEILESISIKDIREGSSRDELIATAVIRVALDSAFGRLSATFELGVSAIVSQEPVYKWQRAGNDWKRVKIASETIVKTEAGQNLKMTEFDASVLGTTASFGETFNNIVGLTLDAVIRIGSLGIFDQHRIKEISAPRLK